MNWNDLIEINKELKTTDIKGKDYVEVKERVKAFRKLFPMGNIKTEIVSYQDGMVVMKATIFDEDGKELSTGHAYERQDSSYICKNNFVEVAETSCVGRAIGFLNIGIDTAIASYDEMKKEKETTTVAKSNDFELLYTTEEKKRIYEYYNVDNSMQLEKDIVLQYIEERKDKLKDLKKKEKERIANLDLSGDGKVFY